MAQQNCITELLTLKNGLKSPLYFNGQVISAEDLTLDRTSHDAELWRMRRLLHGWGVVAGFIVLLEKDQLKILKGYGICPSGAELYLPDIVILSDISQVLLKACGPGAAGCDLEAEPRDENAPLTGWLVARPVNTATAPRAGIPQDCTHPGNLLFPTLNCGAVRLELHCSRPPGHPGQVLGCEKLTSFLCSGAPIAMPAAHPAPDLLVLGRIRVEDGVLLSDYDGRRHLYPVSLIQDFLSACQCDSVQPEPEEPAPDSGGGRPRPGGFDWSDLFDFVRVDPDNPVTDPERLKVLAHTFGTLGLSPRDMIEKPFEEILVIAGLTVPEAEIRQLIDRLNGLRDVITSPEF